MMQGQTPHFDATFDEGQRLQSERSHELHDMAVAHVKRTFFGTLYSFLDTLHMLAFNTQSLSDARTTSMDDSEDNVLSGDASALPTSPLSNVAPQLQYAGLPASKRAAYRRFSFSLPAKSSTSGTWSVTRRHSTAETTRQEQSKGLARHSTRSFFVLATLCNLTAFRLFVVPDLLHSKAVRYIFKLDVADELPQLEKMLRRLDDMIFSYYIRDKTKELSLIVHRGVLMGGFSWLTTEAPKDTQPYVSEALLYLVFTHAEIMDLIAEVGAGAEHHMVKQQPLTKRVFQVLTASLAQDLLESIRAIDSFSEGGMLQCVLESLVISQTLQTYLTAPASESLRLLHSYVRSAFERTQEKAKKLATQQGRPSPRLAGGDLREVNGVALAEEHWDSIQKLLRDCTRRTQIQFRCFQPSSPPSM
ncbi:Exocyst complex component S5 [Coemansia furcata]|nr:Exocyst complex component S5 [Coemansia furcata]